MTAFFGQDPFQGYRFRVDVFDIGRVVCHSVDGLDEETDVSDYRTGEDPPTFRKLTGLTKFGNITLERGLDPDNVFDRWRALVADGKRNFNAQGGVARKNVQITLLDMDNGSVPLVVWIAQNGVPATRNHPTLDAASSDPLFDKVEIAHEGLFIESRSRVQVPSRVRPT